MRNFYLNEFKKILPIIINSQNSYGFFGPLNNVRWQEAILSLLLFNKEEFRKNILKGIYAWSKLQNKNGSFPERVNESYAATAFSLYAVVRCLNELEETDYIENIRKACEYLCSTKRIETPNQEAAAGLALIEASKLLDCYKNEGRDKIVDVIKIQTKDGWFPEYGGPDIGYNSLTLEILGLVYSEKILKSKINNSAKAFIDWVKYFIFPDGSVGGSYNKRSGGWLILDAFEIFKKNHPIANRIIEKHIEGHKRKIFDATHLINRTHIMTDSWRLLSAYKNSKDLIKEKKLLFENGYWNKFFKYSKFYVFKKQNYMGIISANENTRCGLTLWKPNKILIDLNFQNPKLLETTLDINSSKVEIIGYLYSEKIERLSRRISFLNNLKTLFRLPITKYKITYSLSDNVTINSNKPLTISGFGISGRRKKIGRRNNVFFKKKYMRIERGRFFEI